MTDEKAPFVPRLVDDVPAGATPELPPPADVDAKARAPVAEVGGPGELPQGVHEFYEGMKTTTTAAFQAMAPFQGKHPAIDNNFGEVLRYLELSSMYMDRLVMYLKNPHLLQRAEPADGKKAQ